MPRPRFAPSRPLLWVLCLAAALAAGCADSRQAREYYADEELRQQQESAHYQLTYNSDANAFLFDEGPVRLRISVYLEKTYAFQLELTNTTDRPVVIDWNRVEYLDTAGNPHSMIHHGVPYYAPLSAQKPTTVPPGGTITDLLRPADRVVRDGAVRLGRPRRSPAATDQDDGVTILLPVKALGGWQRYRLSVQVGMATPGALPERWLP
jgi:hypothetical protein